MRFAACFFAALLVAAFSVVSAVRSAAHERYLVVWGMESRVFPGDRAGHDFLAVFEVGNQARFGRLVSMLPVLTRSQMAHHANYDMPPNGMLFANDFMAAQSYVFDLRDPRSPHVAASFGDAGPYTHPHSFAYLSNGHELATYQQKGADDTQAGALVELDASGQVVRASDASDPRVEPFIRPYSLQVLEKIDRVVTTSADMMPSESASHVVQVWRLSDLKLLKTVLLPKPTRYKGIQNEDPDEARVLADGRTVLVQTGRCGLYRLDNLTGTDPTAQFVYDLGYRACPGVPLVIGNFWIEPSMSGHCVTALDIRDPSHPREVSRITLGGEAYPHWLGRDPNGQEIVITGFGSLVNRISFASFDPRTGALSLEKRAIEMNRAWPDGWTGPAVPHATLFYRK